MPASPQSVIPERVNRKIMKDTEEYLQKEIEKEENARKRFANSVKFIDDILKERGKTIYSIHNLNLFY